MTAKNLSKYFTEHGPEVERLRPLPPDATFEYTETQYMGFQIPEHRIQAEIWLWHRPAVKVTYGGLTVWQGKNTHPLQAKCLDIRYIMPMPEDITNGSYPTGMRVQVLEPLKKVRLTHDNPEQSIRFDVELNAIMPPAFRANPDHYKQSAANWGYTGGHYSQAMKTSGVLSLEGRDYAVDGYFTRDRSWGETRSEKSTHYPPIGWHCGVVDDSFAFHVYGFEEFAAGALDRLPGIALPSGVRWGYVWVDGELRGIEDARIAAHTVDDIVATGFEITLLDSAGETHELKGTVETTHPAMATAQLYAYWLTVRWEVKGRVGWGNCQYATWHKYYKAVFPGPGA